MRADDVTLIRRTLEGDQSAFTALVNKYQKRVHALVWRKIGDFHIAEEITQDVFLKVYKKLSTLKPPEHFPGWLYVITTRHCIAWLRKKRHPTTSLDAMPAPELEELCYAEYEASRGETTAVEHQREIVKRLLQKLPESERTVVTLHYLSEMSCEDISEFLGVSPNTIKSRLHRARKRLEKQEHLLHDVSGIFRLSPTLTENIMREVARIKPPAPSVSKPWLPWGASLASALLIILMIGFGARALLRFQQPYNLDAESEMIIELVETPVVLPLQLKPDVRTQLGSTNTIGKNSSTGSRTNAQPLVALQSEAVEVLDTEPQWIQSEKLTGGDVKNLFLTSDKALYAVGGTGLYRLTTDDNSTGWTLINASLPLTPQSEPMVEWDETLYIATRTSLFASTDRGVTWHTLGPRPQGRAIALLITNPKEEHRPRDIQMEMYLVLADGVFRSTDVGNTWHALNDGLTVPEIQDAIAIRNVLFLGTRRGLYRLNSSVWEKLPVAQSQSIGSLAVADNRIYLSTEKQENQASGSLFASNDCGESWVNITPSDQDLELFPLTLRFTKLVAVGETVLALGTHVLHSADAGNTWKYLGFDRHAFTLGTDPAVALDENTVFVVGTNGVRCSTDGGSTWHPFMTGITELRVRDLAQVNDVLYAVTDEGIAKSTDGGERWTYVGTGLLSPVDKSLDTLELSNMTTIGSALYVRAKQGGRATSLFRLLPNTDTLLHIKGMPVYVDSNDSKWLENIAYTAGTFELNETDQASLFRYQLGIEEAATKTTGEFAVSGGTFYIEYERKLYRWTYGDRKWHDTGMQDTPVFADFYAADGFQFAASGEIIYVAKSNGNLFQSLDGGHAWRDVTANFPFPMNRAESQDQLLKKLPHFREIIFVGSTVYVSTNDGIAVSNDGANWHVLTDAASAPIPMRQLAVHGTVLYGVSQTGAYQLNKNAGIWEQITSEIPGQVTSFAVARNTLYIGTEHRGILRFPLDSL